eukprot:CAMPEP_0184379684 /NCGR_PEP_ID=MMETSP0007-20130409/4077_1 /TAXON_ID=97485 /ORGANISM="Prymnesium parvum, Strain Texoma1" /LENGTH=73 /DNA_ID=CAMNT_0026724511 /DNA_START=233 /DNA_END=455 /DNA_ORIENTATION=+
MHMIIDDAPSAAGYYLAPPSAAHELETLRSTSPSPVLLASINSPIACPRDEVEAAHDRAGSPLVKLHAREHVG